MMIRSVYKKIPPLIREDFFMEETLLETAPVTVLPYQ